MAIAWPEADTAARATGGREKGKGSRAEKKRPATWTVSRDWAAHRCANRLLHMAQGTIIASERLFVGGSVVTRFRQPCVGLEKPKRKR
jgi:hypothetical protein